MKQKNGVPNSVIALPCNDARTQTFFFADGSKITINQQMRRDHPGLYARVVSQATRCMFTEEI